MFRSKIQLADTLSVLESERGEHADEVKACASKRAELEDALRAADEVRVSWSIACRYRDRIEVSRARCRWNMRVDLRVVCYSLRRNTRSTRLLCFASYELKKYGSRCDGLLHDDACSASRGRHSECIT